MVLAVTDTIGVLYGDTAREFGAITDAQMTPDGRLMVLDGLKARLSIFDREGRLLRTLGRQGSGPGEFQYPRNFAQLSDGGLAITDWGGASVSFFDDSLAFEGWLQGFYPTAPVGIRPTLDGDYVGGCITLASGGDYSGESYIGRWSDGMQPDRVYLSHTLAIELVQVGEDVAVNVDPVEVVWDTDPSGNLFTAVMCDSLYEVVGFTPQGDTLLVIRRSWERVPKTAEELEREVYGESLSRSDEGTSVNRREAPDPYPFHNAISSIRCDSLGRIWVGQGWTPIPTFEVYSPDGELELVAAVPDLEGVTGLNFDFLNGSLAWDFAPLDYPKVYMLESAD